MRNEKTITIMLVILSLLGTLFMIATGNLFTKKLALDVDDIAPIDFYAPYDIENTIATDNKKSLASSAVEPIFALDETILESIIARTQSLFEYVDAVIKIRDSSEFAISVDLSRQFSIPTESSTINYSQILHSKSDIPLMSSQYDLLLQASQDLLNDLEERVIVLLKEIYSVGINEADIRALDIGQMILEIGVSPMYQLVLEDIIELQLVTNLRLDEEATEELRRIASDAVEPVMVVQGEKIIGRGSRITEEAYLLLEKSGEVGNSEVDNIIQYVGGALFILVMYCFILHYVNLHKVIGKLTFGGKNLLFMLYILTLIMARLMINQNYEIIPLHVGSMIIAMLLGKQVAVLFHVITTIVTTLIFNSDMSFIIYHLVVGTMGIFVIVHMKERKDMLKIAIILGALQCVIAASIALLVGAQSSTNDIVTGAMQSFGIGMFAVIFVGGSLPMWESAFNFVTAFQLLELTNPNQPLLRRLLLEATGTYHHSLLVANLAETAANDIGANPLLARVGGYYHDIGKLTCGNYFKENQTVENPHDYLDPRSSAGIIISHVTAGMELATQYNLPKCVCDMIIQHHGQGVMQYFYIKAQNAGEENIRKEDFTYPGPKPQTKEAALIMLADVVEATTRSMQHKFGPDFTLEDLVRKMVRQKLDEGELDECPLYISDIETVIQSFTRTLKGMYHERIEYPERKENS
ncbi:MAG: hypothetical protein ATN33_07100 [Epulopiscium sp. Nele67-Bin001]|nr:MAG: hypothetical protein BEN18_00070 [Epulopiscium sp. Nuni2H_MBin001]OON92556.1 MAG: hypothetical protein ATN33_07100 [Epulopiscium sp. Nele67-Bin001]